MMAVGLRYSKIAPVLKHHTMNIYGGMAVKLHKFLILALVGAPHFSHLTTTDKAPSTYWRGGCMVPVPFWTGW